VFGPERELHGVVDAQDARRSSAAFKGAVAELAASVDAPARDRARPPQRARVRRTGFDRDDAWRRGRALRRAVPGRRSATITARWTGTGTVASGDGHGQDRREQQSERWAAHAGQDSSRGGLDVCSRRMVRAAQAFDAARAWLARHPEELGRFVRNALGLRVGVPIDAFRWIAAALVDAAKVEDVRIEARPPGLALAGTFDLMKSRVRAQATIFVDRVRIDGHQMRLELRLEEVSMTPVGSARTPISALLRAEALDLSRPGDLVAHLPDMPAAIVAAQGNRLALDLMKVDRLASDPRVRHAVGLCSALVTLDRVATEPGHLDLDFRPVPQGLTAAADAVGDHLLAPGWRLLRRSMPVGVARGVDTAARGIVDLVAGADPDRDAPAGS
jgi:hypothetical protein